MSDPRELIDLVSVGKAFVRDFHLLGITTVEQLKKCTAKQLFEQLKEVTGQRQDPCVEDGFRAAIEQANAKNAHRERFSK